MSRKDFELIAAAIRELSPMRVSEPGYVARKFATALISTNPNFDADRFIKACTA